MMAPPWVLLERRVEFVHGDAEVAGGTSEDDVETSAGGASREVAASGGSPTSPTVTLDVFSDPEIKTDEEISDEVAEILEAMAPDPDVFAPPEISRLSMVHRMEADELCGGIICSTHKALVVLYAGDYQPGFTDGASSGCHLVYDASSNSLSAIPLIPDPSYTFNTRGLGAAILSSREGTYMLAELGVPTESGFPEATLYLWRCPNSNQGQWIRKAVILPQVFTPTFSFKIDMSFAYAGSSVCWVDLVKGVLVCNLLQAPEPEFTFVPLPEGYSTDFPMRCRPRPEEFRSMGCVNGVIKFVALVGYSENWPKGDVTLRTWTLSPDLKEWKEGTPLRARDLWASESFLERGLPKLTPSFPIVSMDEPEVVYVILNDIDRVPAVSISGELRGMSIVFKAQYMLRLDTTENKVLQSTKVNPNNVKTRFHRLLASEFSKYLQGTKDHRGGLEASEAGASRKRMKH